MKDGMTELQAVYRMEYLVFVVRQVKELMKTVLKVYGARIERIQKHCKKDEEYNLDLLSRLYEAVKNHFLLPQSDQLFRIISCS
jgi:hypothetical protein